MDGTGRNSALVGALGEEEEQAAEEGEEEEEVEGSVEHVWLINSRDLQAGKV